MVIATTREQTTPAGRDGAAGQAPLRDTAGEGQSAAAPDASNRLAAIAARPTFPTDTHVELEREEIVLDVRAFCLHYG